MTNPSRILSGIQPTGNIHLGNYLGAIRNWVGMQNEAECLFMLADMHAITLPYVPAELRACVRSTAAYYIACGIDPDKSAIFPQSAIAGHAELSWILTCHTPLGWLNRMTQFKEKAGKHKDNASLGLYSYPVLMAADILLYRATHVPVGEDQKQHLELARDIAGAMNRFYEQELFPLPEPVIMKQAARIMSLRDGTKKMSKSDESEQSRIHLSDSNDAIATKIRKAKSDMLEGISYDLAARPEASNLLSIYATIQGISIDEAQATCGALNFSSFKERLAEALIAHLTPIREKYHLLMNNPAYLDGIMHDGISKARIIADDHMRHIKEVAGFYSASHDRKW
ncbi:MAG: tryptophan--tRNA ligase [Alphaproteobacteria bacterium]|nr:MAG: tryptophan--tRNA ligase [Alphaproteobacteria bacterium]TAF76998.1 MAG: tryptophan--tRNA ligase [Alphaproteobacteria bacterium]